MGETAIFLFPIRRTHTHGKASGFAVCRWVCVLGRGDGGGEGWFSPPVFYVAL